jgi:hypothetical protein
MPIAAVWPIHFRADCRKGRSVRNSADIRLRWTTLNSGSSGDPQPNPDEASQQFVDEHGDLTSIGKMLRPEKPDELSQILPLCEFVSLTMVVALLI